MVSYGIFVFMFGCAAIFDVVYMRIQNILSIIIFFLFVVAVGVNPDGIDWLGHVITGAAVFAVGAICFYLGYWGGGDVKLMPPVRCGWDQTLFCRSSSGSRFSPAWSLSSF